MKPVENTNLRPSSPFSSDLPNGERGSKWYLAGICLAASIGGLLFGFDTAVISGTVEFVQQKFALGTLEVGWFASSALAGCILGASIAGFLSDRLGRKPILLVSAIFFLLGAVFSAIAQDFQVLIFARLIGGLGVGFASVLAPMFISEFSPPKIRGRLVALYQLSIVAGILIAYFSNWMVLHFAPRFFEDFGDQGWLHWIMVEELWRGMFGVGVLPAIGFFLSLLFVPESPRWLVKAGRSETALSTLTRIAGKRAAEEEMLEIRQAFTQVGGSLAELLQPGLRMALLTAVGLSVFGQLSGVNIVVYFGPEILKSFQFGVDAAFAWQVVLGIINLICTVSAIFAIDSWGRRPLLIYGMAAVATLLAVSGILLRYEAPAWAIAMALCLYMAAVSVSICAVIWVITAEIFPNRIRGSAMSIATFANWSTNMLIVFLFPWFVNRYGVDAGFFTYAGICAVATLFFWYLVPETKGKSLEEIERQWLR